MATLVRAIRPFYFDGEHPAGSQASLPDASAASLINAGDAVLASTPIPVAHGPVPAVPNTSLFTCGLY